MSKRVVGRGEASGAHGAKARLPRKSSAEVKRLNAEWDALVKKLLPIHEQLMKLQSVRAKIDRLERKRRRIVNKLRPIGDRLIALGAVSVGGMNSLGPAQRNARPGKGAKRDMPPANSAE